MDVEFSFKNRLFSVCLYTTTSSETPTTTTSSSSSSSASSSSSPPLKAPEAKRTNGTNGVAKNGKSIGFRNGCDRVDLMDLRDDNNNDEWTSDLMMGDWSVSKNGNDDQCTDVPKKKSRKGRDAPELMSVSCNGRWSALSRVGKSFR